VVRLGAADEFEAPASGRYEMRAGERFLVQSAGGGGYGVTEHRVHDCPCVVCGTTTRGRFPDGVNAPVQYGARIRSFVIYLLHYQLLPEDRLAELMADLFDVKLAAATIARMSQTCAERLRGFTERVTGPSPVTTPLRAETRAYSAAWRASARSTRAAQYLNSGIFPNGSSAGLVRRLAAAST
jgi:transposase